MLIDFCFLFQVVNEVNEGQGPKKSCSNGNFINSEQESSKQSDTCCTSGSRNTSSSSEDSPVNPAFRRSSKTLFFGTRRGNLWNCNFFKSLQLILLSICVFARIIWNCQYLIQFFNHYYNIAWNYLFQLKYISSQQGFIISNRYSLSSILKINKIIGKQHNKDQASTCSHNHSSKKKRSNWVLKFNYNKNKGSKSTDIPGSVADCVCTGYRRTDENSMGAALLYSSSRSAPQSPVLGPLSPNPVIDLSVVNRWAACWMSWFHWFCM